MCNCVNEIEGKLLESLREKYPDARGYSASLSGQSLKIPRSTECGAVKSQWIGFTPVNASVVLPLRKNPTANRLKKVKMNMYFSYCPYCGVKYG